MTGRLSGKVAIVTGGGTGIGEAISRTSMRSWLPAKGAVGMLAGSGAKTPPPNRIDLRHTHDGNRNKDLVKLQ